MKITSLYIMALGFILSPAFAEEDQNVHETAHHGEGEGHGHGHPGQCNPFDPRC